MRMNVNVAGLQGKVRPLSEIEAAKAAKGKKAGAAQAVFTCVKRMLR
jgi:hypothetical protein